MTKATPVQVEVIRNAFNSIAEEMSVALFRSAHTSYIYESKDCAVGIYDGQGRLLGQAPGLPIFLGGLGECIKYSINHFGKENLEEGDVIVLNDAYVQGAHQTDVTVLGPIFFQEQLVGFAANRADGGHFGGKDLGISNDTIHIYQEGIRIPPVKIVKRGEIDRELMDIFVLNSNFHENRRGDLGAQIAACMKGSQRLQSLYAKYGVETIAAATEDIFRQSRALDSAAVRAIPDGVYTAEAALDSDGVATTSIPIKVKVTVSGESMEVDVAGSSGPTAGPINAGWVATTSGARLGFKQLINPDKALTGGNFDNLSVPIPENSIFNAHEPAPCQFYYAGPGMLPDLIQTALAPVIPEKVAAAHFGDSMVISFYATDDDDREGFCYIAAELGGWGGFDGNDGQDCMINVINGDYKSLPTEFVESQFPLTILHWGLREDSGGAGKFRGGLGTKKVFRVDADQVHFSCRLDRRENPAWGILGGKDAHGGYVVFNEGLPSEQRFNRVNDLQVNAGDTLTVYTGGGGGYGDPSQRPLHLIERDRANGYLTDQTIDKEYRV